MSDFDVRYHLQRLEQYSGQKWSTVPSNLNTALAEVTRVKRARAAVLTTARTLRFVALMALACALLGVAQGVIGLGLFRTIGPVVALILGGLPTFATSFGVDLYLRVAVIGDMDRDLANTEAQYQKRLDEAIA